MQKHSGTLIVIVILILAAGGIGLANMPTATLVLAYHRIALYEMLTGQTLEPGAYPANPRIASALQAFL